MKTLLSVFFALVGAGSAAHANTWHVATTGNDSNAGTAASPWRTIQRAATAVQPGDTVTIHAGTYTGFVVNARGTAAAPIAFVADGEVRIDGAATADRDAVHVEGASYVTIEGLTVTGAGRAGISALDCDHITVRKNRVDQNTKWGVFSSFCDDLVVEDNEVSRSGTQHGVYASNSADRPIIRNNVIWGNAMCGVHMNGDINFGGDGVISGAVVENNVIRDNGRLGGSAINGDGVTGAVIRNNVLDGNHASGISLYQIDGGLPSTGNKVVNNTVRMASDARWAVNIQDRGSGNVLRNNILLNANTGRGAIDTCAACLTGMVFEHNAVVGRFMVDGVMTDFAGWRTRIGADTSSFVATDGELFASATDLKLRAGSPAVDRGVATDAPATDVLGTTRPQGSAVDIGAYEYCEGPCADTGDGDGDGSGGGDGTGSGGSGDGTGPDYDGTGAGKQSSGGCSVQHGATGSLALLVVAALAFVRRRRSR
jgi:MYXO-CTERM domain-containing protein